MTSRQKENAARWRRYLGARTGTYASRCKRYAAVYDRLHEMGLAWSDLVVDVGAGMCEFGRYLYRERNWVGQYVPIDGSIDGRDLGDINWEPPFDADFYVAIELVEHVYTTSLLIERMVAAARKGVVVTTPHTDFLGLDAVLQMDGTHVNPIRKDDLRRWGALDVRNVRCFSEAGETACPDTLLATWKGRANV